MALLNWGSTWRKNEGDLFGAMSFGSYWENGVVSIAARKPFSCSE
jgi:hypothetical protein